MFSLKEGKCMMQDKNIFKLPGLVMTIFCVGLLGIGMVGFVVLQMKVFCQHFYVWVFQALDLFL